MASQVHVSVTGSLTSVKKLEQGNIEPPKEEVEFSRGRAKGHVQQKISMTTI